ncbi:ribosome recycling factor [Buchananella hordeovulneris]|uniref:ribosome recycling factor n=1 Tax=Buchananella hordeovulneris TaxID=52770 RepID=UPI0026DAFD77|nr:ribosome recycling factor [Buchananella hordeovulneris]MDO5080351.1 ribosome recycling factor [Buchananella hordeovulneris]
MIEEIMLEAEEKMDKALAVARSEFAAIRTGRANAAMFNSIEVEYYGAPTPLQQLATLNIPEARTVLISPFDRTATNEIMKAIRESDLGVNPSDDGQVIRVVLPALTEERRRDYVKLAKTKAEEARVSVRGIRRKAKEELERLVKDKEVGEDEVQRAEKELESVTKKHTDAIDEALAAKESELLTV